MSLIEVFFFRFFFLVGVGGGGAVVICSPFRRYENIISDVVRPSGCPFIFSVHAIFDDPVKVIW